MANLNDHASRYRKGLSNPFTSVGLKWCAACRMDVDTRTASHHRGTMYVYKQTCLRCGAVLDRGVCDNVVLVGRPLPAAAVEWTLEPDKVTR